MTSYLVMLQTNSNQPFIFSSPRLREQIGASFEITLLSQWVKEAAEEELLEQKPLQVPNSFWVSDSSGKVIVRFTGNGNEPKKKAKDLIRQVTLRALTDAPGLDVTGVFITTDTDEVQPHDLEKLDREFSAYSLNRRPAAARFPQFPYLIRADESALPASTSLHDLNLVQDSLEPNNFDEKSSLSLPSRVKRAFATTSRRQQVKDVKRRLAARGKKLTDGPELDPTKLAAVFQDGEESEVTEDMLSSVGVVHIDGNGVGAIMRDLGSAFEEVKQHLDALEDASYRRKTNPCKPNDGLFQWFVMEVNYRLDGVVNQAVAEAWATIDKLASDNRLKAPPVVPVLVGGDDVTVYTDGRYAIPFAEAYIRHYERLTGEDNLLKELAVIAGAPEPGSLTASAGAGIVGRNFPFHIAYDLAEGLVSRGKKLGKKPGASPCSTIDFHVLRDTTVLDPQDTLDEYEGRTQRPFLVGHYAPERIGDATTASASDGVPQTRDPWKRILRAVAAFNGRDPDSPDVARSDPFPRARANRIVKLLAEETRADEANKTPQDCLGYVLKDNDNELATQKQIDEDASQTDETQKRTKRCAHPIYAIRLEWEDALENARGAKELVRCLWPLPSQSRLAETTEAAQAAGAATMNGADGAEKPDGSEKNAERKTPEKTEDLKKRKKLIEDYLEQVKWLLDLIDLSENLPNGYIDSFVKAEQSSPSEAGQLPDADGVGHAPAGNSSEGGDK